MYAQIECFLSAEVHGIAGDEGSPQHCTFAVIQLLRSASQHRFAGTVTTVAADPVDNFPLEDMYLVSLRDFRAQMLLLKGRDDITNVRFVDFPSKLHLV